MTAVAASVLLLSGCMPVIAPGPIAFEERPVDDDVTAVVLGTSGDLAVIEGEPGLTVRAPEAALQALTSQTHDGILVLGSAPGMSLTGWSAAYDLTLPALTEVDVNGSGDAEVAVPGNGSIRIEVNGSGDVSWSELSSDRVEVRVAGSGNVRLHGSADEIVVEIDGSGDVDATEVDAAAGSVVIRGSGDVELTAHDSLVAEIAGSGRVIYHGDPRLDTNVWGSGEVVRG
ncbi:GIN domain-containing protein [Microbacterium sp. NPDC057407]|uniref:GIN domain-containing protein n=1 Tax=Microbacterium sp. NPDC057407 TaxID=3346120 RepID=UPI003672FE37